MELRGAKLPFSILRIRFWLMNQDNILHKTTYIWKEDEGYAIIIKNNGAKAILNKFDTMIWKVINDEDSVREVKKNCKDRFNLDEGQVEKSIEKLMDSELITCEDMFWGDDLL